MSGLPVAQNAWCRAVFLVNLGGRECTSSEIHELLKTPIGENPSYKPKPAVIGNWLNNIGASIFGVHSNTFRGRNVWSTDPRAALKAFKTQRLSVPRFLDDNVPRMPPPRPQLLLADATTTAAALPPPAPPTPPTPNPPRQQTPTTRHGALYSYYISIILRATLRGRDPRALRLAGSRYYIDDSGDATSVYRQLRCDLVLECHAVWKCACF
jgi:hypothetical protein